VSDPVSDAVLDAARAVFEQYGARRANVDDIAAAAGMSRSTLYRRYPNKEALLAAVVARELDAFFDELDRVAADLPPQEAVIECFVRGLAIMREIPVLGRLSQTEPEVVTGMPGRGHMLLAQSDRVARTLRRSGARMPDEDLLMASELLLRLATTYLLDPHGHLDLTDHHAVRDVAKRYLANLVE
jgi:TetR/AcrR family transcriptional regulator